MSNSEQSFDHSTADKPSLSGDRASSAQRRDDPVVSAIMAMPLREVHAAVWPNAKSHTSSIADDEAEIVREQSIALIRAAVARAGGGR